MFLAAFRPVTCKPATPAKREFLEIARTATFWKMHMREFSKCRNFSCYIAKQWLHHRRSPNSLKLFRTFKRNIWSRVSFQYSYPRLHAWFSVNIHVIHSSRQMKMLQKTINVKDLKILKKMSYNGVCFGKIASLQCTDYISAFSKLYHRFFLEYVPSFSFLKKNILEKSLWFTNCKLSCN